jgi:hypothetical protein
MGTSWTVTPVSPTGCTPAACSLRTAPVMACRGGYFHIRRTSGARESIRDVTLTEQETLPRCALCGQPAAGVLPMPRPSVDDDPRPGVPLCVGHRREQIGGASVVGWCPGGAGHYGRQSTRCAEHGLFFTDPLA